MKINAIFLNTFFCLIYILTLSGCDGHKSAKIERILYTHLDTITLLQSSINSMTMLPDIYNYQDSTLKIIKSGTVPFSYTLYWMNKKISYLDSNDRNMMIDTVGMADLIRRKKVRTSSFEMLFKAFTIKNDTATIESYFKNLGLYIQYKYVKTDKKWLLINYSYGWH